MKTSRFRSFLGSLVLDLSLNFWFVLPSVLPSLAPTVDPSLEAFFNGLLCWALCFFGFASDEEDFAYAGGMLPYLVGSLFLTEAVVAFAGFPMMLHLHAVATARLAHLQMPLPAVVVVGLSAVVLIAAFLVVCFVFVAMLTS